MITSFLRLDFSIAKRYRFRILTDSFQFFLTLCLFYYLSKSFGPNQMFKGEYFPYLLIGLLFNRFYQTVTGSAVSQLIDYQYLGVLETILAGQKQKWKVLISSGFPEIIRDLLITILTLSICIILFDFQIINKDFNFSLLLLTIFLVFILSLGLSLISLGSILRWKRVNLVTFFSSLGTSLLTGVYFPINILPEWVQAFCNLIPLTHALRMIRYSLGNPIEDTNLTLSLSILGVTGAISLIGGFLFYLKIEKVVLKKGSLLRI